MSVHLVFVLNVDSQLLIVSIVKQLTHNASVNFGETLNSHATSYHSVSRGLISEALSILQQILTVLACYRK